MSENASTPDQLRSLITSFRGLVHPDRYELLENTDLVILPEPLCLAHANHKTNTILLYQGYLDVIRYRMEVSLILGAIRNRFDEVEKKIKITEAQLNFLAKNAIDLTLHFYFNPSPLPKLSEVFDDRLLLDVEIAFGGGLLFTLLHELGHLVLQHGTPRPSESVVAASALPCSEPMNVSKEQEFEADLYAFTSFLPEARQAFIVTNWFLFMTLLDIEIYNGPSLNSNPMAINRMSRLQEISFEFSDPSTKANIQRIFDNRLNLMRLRQLEAIAQQKTLSQRELKQINRDAAIKVLGFEEANRLAIKNLVEIYGVLD